MNKYQNLELKTNQEYKNKKVPNELYLHFSFKKYKRYGDQLLMPISDFKPRY